LSCRLPLPRPCRGITTPNPSVPPSFPVEAGSQAFLGGVDRVELKQLIIEGSAAAAVVGYDYVNAKGEHLHQDDVEVWRVETGEVLALTIYFDITAFRAFMGR
jgi:hypothetical protein